MDESSLDYARIVVTRLNAAGRSDLVTKALREAWPLSDVDAVSAGAEVRPSIEAQWREAHATVANERATGIREVYGGEPPAPEPGPEPESGDAPAETAPELDNGEKESEPEPEPDEAPAATGADAEWRAVLESRGMYNPNFQRQ